ncbi:hypothetical protein DPMN_142226 [Dreissena polymorpha]|uniref:Ig-like domain-containing protein n=1 Tax=Dreissena polymorpha TaxID=45954 RepID=A0A9D4GB94_DREPO|nr:hypothetical protein DPMN_142226 [Dreissena polymorpha]
MYNGSSPSVGHAVGGAVGGTVLIVIVFGLFIFLKKFKRVTSLLSVQVPSLKSTELGGRAPSLRRPGSNLDIERNIRTSKRILTINLHTSDCNSRKIVAATSRGYNEITLIITVPVVYATLTPDVPTISVLPNMAVSYIRCKSSVGRPAPSITWYLDNRTPSDYSDDVDITGNSISSTVSDVTASSITLTPTSNDHDAWIYCNVSKGYGKIMSNRSLTINVFKSQYRNQYETLAHTSFHEYSVLSPGNTQEYSVMNQVSQVSENDRVIVNTENAYVNL